MHPGSVTYLYNSYVLYSRLLVLAALFLLVAFNLFYLHDLITTYRLATALSPDYEANPITRAALSEDPRAWYHSQLNTLIAIDFVAVIMFSLFILTPVYPPSRLHRIAELVLIFYILFAGTMILIYGVGLIGNTLSLTSAVAACLHTT